MGNWVARDHFAWAHSYGDRYRNCDANGYRDSYRYCYCYADCYCHGDSYPDANTNTDGDTNPTAYTYTKSRPVTKGSSHSGAETVTRLIGESASWSVVSNELSVITGWKRVMLK